MTDKLTPEQRHKNMASIHSRDTKPELMVRKYLWHEGFRYKVTANNLPGKPDIVLRKYRTVIFVNGCFWHGHEGCKYFRMPTTNVQFWTTKINRNRARDARVREELKQMGWSTMVVWECQLRDDAEKTLSEVVYLLQKNYLRLVDAHIYMEEEESEPQQMLVAEDTPVYGSAKNKNS